VESLGNGFDIPGVTPVAGDPDGLVGEILFPTLAGAPGVLREDLELPALGLPQDLNGDGNLDGLDHSSDYVLLPVQVRVRWNGSAGPGLLEFETLLASD
jgi:hypothetical protein